MRQEIDAIYAKETGKPERGRCARTWSATASSPPSRPVEYGLVRPRAREPLTVQGAGTAGRMRASCCAAAASGDRVLGSRPSEFDLDSHDVAGGRGSWGGSWPMPTPEGVPVRIRIARRERAGLGDEGHQLLDPLKIRLAVLDCWRSSPLTHVRRAQRVRVGDLVGGRDPGAVRAEAVGALGARPLRLAALQVAAR